MESLSRLGLWGSLLLAAACASGPPAPEAVDLRIVVGFEGSCPQSLEGVKQEGERQYRIFPSWRPAPGIREEAVGRSTRLGFRVANGSGRPQAVELLVDWSRAETTGER